MLNKLESHYSEITKESVQKQSDSSLKSNNTKCKKPTISEINSIATLIKVRYYLIMLFKLNCVIYFN